MKQLVVGILAHVDAGKTTLSEAMLYQSGAIRKWGRVDHGDAFLDQDALERQRGITIFSKQARLKVGETKLTLLDTPGHTDLASEMERTLQVLDCAVLVVSGTDGVQSHTETLWRLLARHKVPTFLFFNKMDLPGADKEALLRQAGERLGQGCVDFSAAPAQLAESLALCGEAALEEYLERGAVSPENTARLVGEREVFPCYFGAALRLQGVDELLQGLGLYTAPPAYPEAFAAKVYKIARDAQGARLTYLKVTGGSLRVKMLLAGRASETLWQEKVSQIRLYSGGRYTAAEEVQAGTVCAVTGLSHTRPGDGLGAELPAAAPVLQPVLVYQVLLPQGCDAHTALPQLRQLEEEDPQLHLAYDERLKELRIQLMGEVQREVLQRLAAERFGLELGFGPGRIVYKETIARSAEGVGHFEPLRHYAEVHLLLEPGAPGSGLQFSARCGEEMLDKSWQRLVLTHLKEKQHIGVLTGSPITDIKITLVAGRAHQKHTEGGDFREATYRAVRQGLKRAGCVLLEPWYSFRLEVPAETVGHALADVQRMGAVFEAPDAAEGSAVLEGAAPVAALQGYALQMAAYTKGRGRLSCVFQGYRPCQDADQVIADIGYDSDRDLENPADSVFCSHGAGFVVKWDEVERYMHVHSGRRPAVGESDKAARPGARPGRAEDAWAQDKELAAIFERTYGPVRRRELALPSPQPGRDETGPGPLDEGPEYVLVDGYNVIFAWEGLKRLAQTDLAAARQALIDLLCNYQGFRQCVLILVFDAYKVPGGTGEVSRERNIFVVYTKEAETADMYIEKTTYQLGKKRRVRVVTSDAAEQLIILGHGTLRVSARAFGEEVAQVQRQIAEILERNNG